jgi:AraC-like DNA-binding protein
MDMRPEIIKFSKGMPVKAFARCVEQYPYHWHDALEIIQVLKGSVHISLGNDNLLLQAPDIAVINMGEIHRITKCREDNEILFIQIDGHFYRSLLPDNRYLFLYCCSPYHEAQAPEKYKILKKYISLLIEALNEKSPADAGKDIGSILKPMLDYITYSFDFLRWGYGTEEFDEKRVERLKQIAWHTTGDREVNLGLKELAAEVDISLQHLSNDIKDRFGLTFRELLYYSKCECAAKRLLSTDGRIVDIALECGFSDPKYLIKHFKKNFHSTPSEFRKLYQTDEKALAAQAQYRDIPLSEAIKYLRRQE